MKFSYNWLKEIAGFRDTPQELAMLLTMRAFEVEGLERHGADWVLDIKILPNRIADASGHRGLAREIAALKNIKLKIQSPKLQEDRTRKTSDAVKISIENPADCSRYTARVMDGVKVGPSPMWMRERLEACGLQSINNVVDAANYCMLETGQPLHVFDFDTLAGPPQKKEIVVRRARKGEYLAALDDKTYELNPDILVIADAHRPLAIAGIKGGRDSGVSESTTRIVLESANFDLTAIRRASQILGLRTDASMRFQHGLDPNETSAAVDRLAVLIRDSAREATIYSGRADQYTRKTIQHAILLRPAYTERVMGTKIPSGFYRPAFGRLGWVATPKGKDFVVKPPTVRRDIEIEEDVIEEIGRLFDYAAVPARMPQAVLTGNTNGDMGSWHDGIRDVLVGTGFMESELYQFTSGREAALFRISPDALIELENPPNEETQYLVPRLMMKYAVSAAENMRYADEVRIFGIGKSFFRDARRASGHIEREDLVLALTRKNADEEGFYELKGAVDTLLTSLGITDHWYDDVPDREPTPRDKFHPHRFAEIKIGDEKIGQIGEIHPDILRDIRSKSRITIAEMDMEVLVQDATAEAEYRPVGKYPAITRDIAVVVPDTTKADDVESVIQTAGGSLLIDVDLFDYFQNASMTDAGEKSMAFHLIFQSSERTLTDTEIDGIMQSMTTALESRPDWEVKK